MKTYIGISRDHSASMRPLIKSAAIDYNSCISSIKDACLREHQEALVTVVKCGAGVTNQVHLDFVDTDIKLVQIVPENNYIANGTGTPLFDSVGELIERLSTHHRDNYGSFLIMVITDGQENASRHWTGRSLAARIRELQATDRWTFTFRVPQGYKRDLINFGIPEGNILEWEQTKDGLENATRATTQAVSNYFTGVSRGIASSKTFYTDLSKITSSEVKSTLVDITKDFKLLHVNPSDPVIIKDFLIKKNHAYRVGSVFYQLTKTEDRVQEYKEIVIRDKKKGRYYGGRNARDLLGLPYFGMIRLVPDDHTKYDIFIQSTSYNRKLVPGTTVLVKY